MMSFFIAEGRFIYLKNQIFMYLEQFRILHFFYMYCSSIPKKSTVFFSDKYDVYYKKVLPNTHQMLSLGFI